MILALLAALAVGEAPATLQLAPVASVNFSPPLDRPASGFGGVFPFKVARIGRYRIRLSGEADLAVADGKVRFPLVRRDGRGTWFQLDAGDYLLILSNARTPAITAEIAP
jgi:hypothetical protein